MFVTTETILGFGVDINTLKTGCKNYRSGKSQSWKNEKDYKDARKVLIVYDTIPATTKRKYGMPETYTDYLNYLQSEENKRILAELEAEAKKSEYEKLLENPEFVAIKTALERDFVKHTARYRELLEGTPIRRERLKSTAENLAKRHALYELLIRFTGEYRNLGASKYHRLLESYSKYHILPEKFTDLAHFTRKLTNYKIQLREGNTLYQALFKPGKYSKDGAQYKNELHTALLLYYASHRKQYSTRQLAELINNECANHNMPGVSEPWVKTKLWSKSPGNVRTLVDAARNGKKWANDNLFPYLSRIEASQPNNTWFIDGTPLQFFYKGNKGQAKRLYLFVVLDACTRKIVGFDITTRGEDKFMVLNALKMAVQVTGYLPFEIVSDNFSASKTEELKAVQAQMADLGVQWRFAQVGNAQDKSYVERFNGTFQSMEQSLLEEYFGEGITSKRRNGRIDPEYLLEITKAKGLQPADKMIDLTAGLICIYNDKPRPTKKAPNELYRTLPMYDAVEMDFIKTAKLFWNTTKATVRRGQITITINKQKHEYWIPGNELRLKLSGNEVRVRYDENNPDKVFIFDMQTDEFIKALYYKMKGYASNADMPEGGEIVYQKFAATKKSYQNYIEQTRTSIINKGLSYINRNIDTYEPISPFDLNKHHLNAMETVEMLQIFSDIQQRELNDPADYTQAGKSIVKTQTATHKHLETNTIKDDKEKELRVYKPTTL